ncbi:hypothetical protein A1359_11195 [Methylomonas lenta]|uniref:Uncharacterized protein n=1 Tax=Methylomonas lenta TaxID=980561 RepID=A0A177NB00_9GAMM|nr:hypothetical protein A1359_11195 [Methylomonas lenta]
MQPVVSIKLTEDLNLITRTILPVVDQSDPNSVTDQFEFGSLNTTLFLSPSKSKAVTWGVGPIFGFPTQTNDLLGSNRLRGQNGSAVSRWHSYSQSEEITIHFQQN